MENTWEEEAGRICKISEEIPDLMSRDRFSTVILLVNFSKADWQKSRCSIIFKIGEGLISCNNVATQAVRRQEMASKGVVNR